MHGRPTGELVRDSGRPTGAPRTRLLQDWITIRSNVTATFVQDEENWLDVGGFADAVFWIDVSTVTPPGGTNTNYVKLTLESAPTCDHAYFQPVASPIWLGTGTTIPVRVGSSIPLVVKSARGPGTPSLSRYLRWRIDPVNAGTWDVTFRIRAVLGRSSFFVPPQLPGCALWLRSDLGVVTTAGGTTISSWADQSGAGNSAAAGAASPTYSAGGGVFGLPKVTTAAGANQYMLGNFASPGVADHTLFSVLGFATPLFNYASFAGTNATNAVNSGFAQFSETPTGLTGRAGSGGAFSSANTSDTSSIGALGIYSTAAASNANVDLYVNGVSKATTATGFTLLSCPKYVLFGLGLALQYNFIGDAYEFIVFNRVLSSTERVVVHRYLGARYGIVVS